jgi:hypothetical protein
MALLILGGCFDGLCGFGGTKVVHWSYCWIQEDIGVVGKWQLEGFEGLSTWMCNL